MAQVTKNDALSICLLRGEGLPVAPEVSSFAIELSLHACREVLHTASQGPDSTSCWTSWH